MALAAREVLAADGVSASVVSMASWELFRGLPKAQQNEIIPRSRPSLSVEAGATQGWLEFVDYPIGLDHFGASAPAETLYTAFGITAAAVATQAHKLIKQ